ncbi:FHA domain-containing protein [Candidatus Venteria ishoeyi]|uniref:FHA domain protein n=1 Tax=Candidatus Venteria ishoeyi TaxID=1899563 RepID=A0A1H6F762_9GAMM|nr:FHA domain-containing protein [Candidatus Venteria ishoeyi]SEH04884.1 FHA domain protein [Candidatus Venteria ishoeyi]
MGIFRDKTEDLDKDPPTHKMQRNTQENEYEAEPKTTPGMGSPMDDFPGLTDDLNDLPVDEPEHDEEPKTRVRYRGKKTNGSRSTNSASATQAESAVPEENEQAMDDPVVGWLVVIDGPGRGNSRQLGYGMNTIGRSSTERVALDYGDSDMTRSKHAIVTYDPRGRKFYLQHGGGQNLTYLNGAPVLVPTELKGGEEVLVGQTMLRFVNFCGEQFDWQDQADPQN